MRADFEGRTGDVGGHNRRSGMPRRTSGGGIQRRGTSGRRKDFRAGTIACRCLLPAAILLALSGLAMAQGPIVNAPTGILNQYQSVRTAWLTTAAGYANRLFGILALIEFAWTGLILVLDKTDLQGWTSALIRRMMFVGAFFALLQFGTTWIPAIIDSFVRVGQQASGLAALSPSEILARGLQITGKLLVGAAESGWLAAFGTALCMVFAALLSFLAFLGLAIQFVVATVESYLVIGAGFLFLGFGGSRWTAPYVERYIAYAVSVGVKIMIIYLLIGAGFILSAGWVTAAGNITLSSQPAIDALDIAAAAVILLMICWHAPKLAAAILGGSPAFTGGDAVATGGALLGGAAAVAGLAAGAVALGAKMLAARGGAMAVSQAAGMGAVGGTAGADLAGGVGGGGAAGGGRGGAGAAASVPGRGAGGGLSGLSEASGQPLPPSSKSSSTVAEPNRATSSSLSAPSQGSPGAPAGGKAQRRADMADAAAQATIRGGMAVWRCSNFAAPSPATLLTMCRRPRYTRGRTNREENPYGSRSKNRFRAAQPR